VNRRGRDRLRERRGELVEASRMRAWESGRSSAAKFTELRVTASGFASPAKAAGINVFTIRRAMVVLPRGTFARIRHFFRRDEEVSGVVGESGEGVGAETGTTTEIGR